MVHAVPAENGTDGEIDRATAAVMRFADGATGLLAATCLLRASTGWGWRCTPRASRST